MNLNSKNFNDLLAGEGIDPEGVIVLRHCPQEPELRENLPLLAEEKPELFNIYQQTQRGKQIESALSKPDARYVAAFIGLDPGEAVFVGLYEKTGQRSVKVEDYWKRPPLEELKKIGMCFDAGKDREHMLQFDLSPMDFHRDWKGKLIIDWPGGGRSWWRRAHKNNFSVRTVRNKSAFG